MKVDVVKDYCCSYVHLKDNKAIPDPKLRKMYNDSLYKVNKINSVIMDQLCTLSTSHPATIDDCIAILTHAINIVYKFEAITEYEVEGFFLDFYKKTMKLTPVINLTFVVLYLMPYISIKILTTDLEQPFREKHYDLVEKIADGIFDQYEKTLENKTEINFGSISTIISHGCIDVGILDFVSNRFFLPALARHAFEIYEKSKDKTETLGFWVSDVSEVLSLLHFWHEQKFDEKFWKETFGEALNKSRSEIEETKN